MFKWMDATVRMLLGAIVLATVLPVGEAWCGPAGLVSNLAVSVLFFLYGLRIDRHDLIAGLRNMRFLVPLALWVFVAMPVVGWILWHLGMGMLPPLLAMGFLYLGVLPSTIQAAVSYSSLAGGDSTTSVVAAAVINVAAVFVTPLLFTLLAGGKAASFHSDALLKVVLLLLLPIVLGQLCQGWAGGWARQRRSLIAWMDRGSIALAVYVAFSGAVTQGLWQRIGPLDWMLVLSGCALLMAYGYAGAWTLGGLLQLSPPQRRSMLFAGAQKSAAMGAPLATILFPGAVAGTVIVPLLTYHLGQMIVAAILAGRLKAKPD